MTQTLPDPTALYPNSAGITSGAFDAMVAALPDDWRFCPACRQPSRPLRRNEADALLRAADRCQMNGADPRCVLEALTWAGTLTDNGSGYCACSRLRAPDDGFWVYRLYGHNRRLIYIGMTRKPSARLRKHRKTFGAELVDALWNAYPSVEEMIAAEREAIAEYQPPANSKGIE